MYVCVYAHPDVKIYISQAAHITVCVCVCVRYWLLVSKDA